jgi:hypothetical protein
VTGVYLSRDRVARRCDWRHLPAVRLNAIWSCAEGFESRTTDYVKNLLRPSRLSPEQEIIFSIVALLVSASFHSLAKSLNAHRGVSIRFLIVACPVVDSRVIRSIISRCSIVRLCFILHNVGIIRRARDERYIHPMHDNRLQKLSARSDHDKLTPIRTDRYFRAIVMTCMFLPSYTV